MNHKISFSNAVLKNIAYVTMFIDHFFAVIVWAMVLQERSAGLSADRLYIFYRAGRAIGRIAFVLFAYFVVEGFLHTKSKPRYLLRMGVFAFVSEIPFDLALNGGVYAPDSQNVYFTLFLGVLALVLMAKWRRYKALQFSAVAVCCLLAAALKTDYMFMGVLLIVVFYCFRNDYKKQALFGGITMYVGIVAVYAVRHAGSGQALSVFAKSGLREMYGLIAFVLLAFYSGERGRHLPKMVCYLFYPVHLLLLAGLKYWMFG